ncbi:MAG: biotin--[acetyl-CoA-carboxylase] ligase [Kiritimatiellia bacterium]
MHLNVAAALILNDEGKVFCVQRGASQTVSTSQKWEFPGGKIERGETASQAAVREVREELNLELSVLGEGPVVNYCYPEFSITLSSVLCAVESGEAVLKEHLASDWCAPDALMQHDFAAADQALLVFLRERFFGAHLHSEMMGRASTFLSSCASTNDEMLQRAEAGAVEGSLVVTETQTAGRGRLGRTWLSEPGQALLFSLLVRPLLPAEIAATVPLVAGLAMAQVLRQELDLDAGLKWPNDILIGDRKVCGILCEAQTSAEGIEGIIIGIGVNVGAVPESVAYRAIGLKGAIDRMMLLAHFCERFESVYQKWCAGGLAALSEELAAVDCKKGKPISVRQSDSILEGISGGIRADGALLLEQPDGSCTPILCGEIAQWE